MIQMDLINGSDIIKILTTTRIQSRVRREHLVFVTHVCERPSVSERGERKGEKKRGATDQHSIIH